jgi:hypothetical protein
MTTTTTMMMMMMLMTLPASQLAQTHSPHVVLDVDAVGLVAQLVEAQRVGRLVQQAVLKHAVLFSRPS